MKRPKIIIRVIVLLLLGAIVNFAVTWGCTLWSPVPGASRGRPDEDSMRGWLREVPSDWPSPNQRNTQNFAFGTMYLRRGASVDRASLKPGDVFLFIQSVRQTGWPMYALESEHRARLRKNAPSQFEWFNDAGEVPNRLVPWAHRGRRWPLLPIWPGFAINTVFYAGILWLLFAAPFALRRRSRLKRGLCPACGYRVGTTDVCTECGKPVAALSPRALPSA